ncbi:MAG TPA: hydroxymethylbilane synthase [Terriglobales bacterium]|nr:hydroxymethylbilane synthase [Terriglobales bacterium]
MSSSIRIGTRGSALALAQANWLRSALQELAAAAEIELVTIQTSGDRFTDRSLRAIGGKGLFVKEIEEALLARSIDCAIHSMKDLPAEIPPGLMIAAIPRREDPRDVLVTRSGCPLMKLPHGARIGTSSLRRMALLRAMRPDLEVIELRGNVDTRLRRLEEGKFDAIVLAAAGLNRLGLSLANAVPFDIDEFLPAIGQGALAVETRDDEIRALIAQLDDGETRMAVAAERAFLRTVGGSCQTPIAAHATLSGDRLDLKALIAQPDGTRVVLGADHGESAAADSLGARLADRLLARGGKEIIAAVFASEAAP